MTRRMIGLMVAASGALALGGCVAGVAAGAAGMAIRSAQPEPESNEHLQPSARGACSAQAARLGKVHIIDVEQRRVDRIVVWGTVTDAKERRSFECGFTNKVTYFKLRPIKPVR